MHLQLESDRLTQAQVDAITQDICLDLSDTGEVRADPEARALAPGERGVATVIGGIAIELLKTAGVTKMIEVLGAYLTQEPSMTAKVTMADGTVIELSGQNVRSPEFQTTVAHLMSQAKGG